MSMYTLLRNKPVPNMEDIDTYFQVRTIVEGNLSYQYIHHISMSYPYK